MSVYILVMAANKSANVANKSAIVEYNSVLPHQVRCQSASAFVVFLSERKRLPLQSTLLPLKLLPLQSTLLPLQSKLLHEA